MSHLMKSTAAAAALAISMGLANAGTAPTHSKAGFYDAASNLMQNTGLPEIPELQTGDRDREAIQVAKLTRQQKIRKLKRKIARLKKKLKKLKKQRQNAELDRDKLVVKKGALRAEYQHQVRDMPVGYGNEDKLQAVDETYNKALSDIENEVFSVNEQINHLKSQISSTENSVSKDEQKLNKLQSNANA